MGPDLQSLRLGFKRTFTRYYLALRSPGIADPTEAFSACHAYLFMLHAQLGETEFMHRLDDETTRVAGEIEQDLRAKWKKGGDVSLAGVPGLSDDLEDRVRECFQYALGRLRP